MKLYLDEDLSPRVTELLRKRGVDALSAHDGPHRGRNDLDQLHVASAEGRCLITRNVGDFVEIVRELVNRQESHAGIILVPASFRVDEFAALADAIAEQARAFPHGLADQVLFLRRPPA